MVPKKLTPNVLQQLYNTVTGGHFGIAKSLGKVRERFHWIHYQRNVQECCRRCNKYLLLKKRNTQKECAAVTQYNVGTLMKELAIDVLEPLPESEAGNKYVLVASDYPIPNQEATTVATVLLKKFVCCFGVPLYIHSDQGRDLEAAVLTEMYSLLGVQKTRSTALHPQSDGMVERLNRTLTAQLSKFVADHQRDWDKYMPLLMMSYHSAEHENIKCSPANLMLGRK